MHHTDGIRSSECRVTSLEDAYNKLKNTRYSCNSTHPQHSTECVPLQRVPSVKRRDPKCRKSSREEYVSGSMRRLSISRVVAEKQFSWSSRTHRSSEKAGLWGGGGTDGGKERIDVSKRCLELLNELQCERVRV